MEETALSRIARAAGGLGSRRRLLGLLTGLSLVGGVADESVAKRKRQGRKRSHRPGKQKDNRRGKRKGDDGLGATQCSAPLTAAGCIQSGGNWKCPFNANLQGADLQSCDLALAELIAAELSGANLLDADLSGANLSGADLTIANLVEANLKGANLKGASLGNAILQSANLSGANLAEAQLNDADLSGADVTGATFNQTICPDGTNTGVNPPEGCCNHYVTQTPTSGCPPT